jgi:hypothetical protein
MMAVAVHVFEHASDLPDEAWGARLGDPGSSVLGLGTSPAAALHDLADALDLQGHGGAALIRTARPQLEIPA